MKAPPVAYRGRRQAYPHVHGTIIALALALASAALFAQESPNVPAATQPSVGRFYLREKFQYVRFASDPSGENREVDKFVATTILAYGLAREWSLSLELPVVWERTEFAGGLAADRIGVNDLSLAVKWRPWQRDLGPVDSVRFALFAGGELPSGSGKFSSDSFDPFFGGIFTSIFGRHGFNAAASYKLNTGSQRSLARPGDSAADAVRMDGSYLFRLSPATYSADTTAATYLTFEANTLYEMTGDWEVVIGPGILYEARTFALEATMGLPALQANKRLATKIALTFGVRFLF